jgi:hypothetical protein
MTVWDLDSWDRVGDELCACVNAYASAAGLDLRCHDERDVPVPPPAPPAVIEEKARALVQAMKAMVEFCLEPLSEDVTCLRICAEVSGHAWFSELADMLEKGAFPS